MVDLCSNYHYNSFKYYLEITKISSIFAFVYYKPITLPHPTKPYVKQTLYIVI